jgi:hypothetical protein
MIRTKQFLTFSQIAAVMAWLLPFAIWAKAKDQASSTKAVRLVLSPQTVLHVAVTPLGNDSVEAKIIVAVPDSLKNQRHLCRLEAGLPVRLFTEPRYQWALRGDTLTVLSSVPLRIRFSQQNFAATKASPLKLRIRYQNLDHAARLAGTAMVNLVAAAAALPASPAKADSAVAAVPSWNSTQTVQAPSSAISADSTTAETASRGGSLGIIYVVITILLILFFGVLRWLMTWSQRRRFQKIEAKSAAMPFSRPEHTQVLAPAAVERTVTPGRDAAHLKTAESPENPEPAASPAPSNLPAVMPENGHDLSLAGLLAQLHELNAGIQQVIANQTEVNHRLAEITSAAKLAAPAAAPQLSLFDMLDDDSGAPHGTNGKSASPQLRIQFAGDGHSDSVSVNLVASSPVNLELFTNDRRRDNLSVALQPSSKLRLLFANTEEGGNGAGGNSDNARLLDSGVSASKKAAEAPA